MSKVIHNISEVIHKFPTNRQYFEIFLCVKQRCQKKLSTKTETSVHKLKLKRKEKIKKLQQFALKIFFVAVKTIDKFIKYAILSKYAAR